MNQARKTQFLAVCILSFFLFSCNQKDNKVETVKSDTTESKTEAQPGYDASMDALKMTGYPGRVLSDSLGLKAYEFVLKPGDSVAMHSHPDHVIYVMEGGTAEVESSDGKVGTAEFKKDACMIFGPEAHKAKNTGTTTIRLHIVHVYRPRS